MVSSLDISEDAHLKGVSMEEETYEAPEIIYEGELEVQAGSPLGLDQLLEEEDPFLP